MNNRISKRLMAFTMALAMTFSLLFSVNAKAIVNPADSDGLVIGYAAIDENDEADFDSTEFHGSIDGISIMSDTYVAIGIKNGDTVAPIEAGDYHKFTITDSEGNPIEDDFACIWALSYGDGLWGISFYELGDYVINYQVDDVTTYSVDVHTELPPVSIYRTGSVALDTLIGNNAEFGKAERTFYINKLDKVSDDGKSGREVSISGYHIEAWDAPEYIDRVVSIEETESGYKVSIAANQKPTFDFIVEADVRNYWTDETDNEVSDEHYEEFCMSFYPDWGEESDYGVYLDGMPQAGFSGCYITEEEFLYDATVDHTVYYVHADSVQGVIDKLSEAAVGGKIPGYVMNSDGTLEKADNFEIVNTGYISVQPSQYGDKVLEPQYVASSGNLNGIRFSASSYDYTLKEDEIYTQVTGHTGKAGDYIELGVLNPELFLDFEGDKLTDAQKKIFEDMLSAKDGFVEWRGKLYSAKRHDNTYTNRDGIKVEDSYFTLASAESFMDITPEMMDDFMSNYIDYLDSTGYAENDYRRVSAMPGLHVNLYCDAMFRGDMGNLVIGFPDKALTGGAYHKAYIDGEYEGGDYVDYVAKPDACSTAKMIVNGGLFTGSYKVRTYAIESELKVAGTAENVEAVVPEPNALPEMSYEQKDAIEAGKKLTVDVKADEIDATGTLDEDTRTAVDAISDAVGDTATDMEYLDFDVSASVEGVSKSTSITETLVPLHITVKPKGGYDSKAKYRIVRYHKGKVDYLDMVDKLFGDVAGLNIGFVINSDGTFSFLADRFSVYAIETISDEKKPTSTGTVSSDGILVLADSPSIVAGLVHAKSDAKDDVEFRWVACEENAGAWFEISPWTKNNEWLNWTPDEAGNYVIVGYARVVGNEEKSLISKPVGVVYSKHVIKDICQIPYEDGYLIGFESTQNPNQSYQYEMLVMDLTLYAAGNPNCWILSTGRATVSEGNAIWITWKPQYGYYLTLFRVYDGNGKLLDQTCYGFANAY